MTLANLAFAAATAGDETGHRRSRLRPIILIFEAYDMLLLTPLCLRTLRHELLRCACAAMISKRAPLYIATLHADAICRVISIDTFMLGSATPPAR